jgi:diaminohydroxyphosphoribosylaminopyrimidine deaminase/5-amino-6-(5-phosphoribosylamino)uracil reductase
MSRGFLRGFFYAKKSRTLVAVFTASDKRFMKKALELAEKGRGHTMPNPMVGAVIVMDGIILSEGYHRKAGEDHAEIDAIKNSPEPVKGSTIYVTLEPCTVSGRTPPCTDELIRRGFSKVVIGAVDPNPKVMGAGIKKLEAAGIEVAQGLYEDEAKKQNEVFFKNMETGMPFVCAKIASSIDGKLAAPTSDSKWITGGLSRKKVQDLRWEYGCVLTGINTVLADDPTLFPKKKLSGSLKENIDSFLGQEESKRFTRVILDSKLRIPPDSSIVKTSDRIRTIIIADSTRKKTSLNDHMVVEYKGSGSWKLREILKHLYNKYGIASVMLEAGPTILTSFLNEGLIDKFMFFVAPRIIGGQDIYNMFKDTGVKKIKDSIGIIFDSFESSGDDILITAYPSKEKGL